MLRSAFLDTLEHPFVVVSTLSVAERAPVIEFLIRLNAPVYLEGVSGIREVLELEHLRISQIENLWQFSERAGYKIDGLLRIGGVPTCRPWRDLEESRSDIAVCSISRLPFSGSTRGVLLPFEVLYESSLKKVSREKAKAWLEWDKKHLKKLGVLFDEEPLAEPSFLRRISDVIPNNSRLYLGNSLPIREWDLAATYKNKQFEIFASRGMNGIDGQVSTFLGMAEIERDNWGIFGDLTFLYDLSAPWILSQIPEVSVNFVVINNGGGKIFSKMSPMPEFQNKHTLNFEHIAKQWDLEYFQDMPCCAQQRNRLIEYVPCEEATHRFWKKYFL